MEKTIIFLRSLLFNIFFFGWSFVTSIINLPLLFILPSKSLVLITGRMWAFPIIWALNLICGIKYEIRGLKNLPNEPCVIACKHQSAWETIIFYKIFKYPTFVLKKELTKIPLYGKYLTGMRSIVVDRDAGASALKDMVRQSEKTLADKRTIIIFPEGTRVNAGEKGTYHPGISAIYARCGAPVVPAALNSGKFWARNSFLKKPGKIILEILPPIEKELRRDQFMEQLETTIESRTNALLG